MVWCWTVKVGRVHLSLDLLAWKRPHWFAEEGCGGCCGVGPFVAEWFGPVAEWRLERYVARLRRA
jgi:hypothetical protein